MELLNIRERLNEGLRTHYDSLPDADPKSIPDLAAVREVAHMMEKASIKENPNVHVYEKYIDGHPDNEKIRIRIYEPLKRTEHLPCLLFFHGGGYVFGGIERHETILQHYTEQVNCICVSAEYRLAPEAKAPAAAEDGYATLQWLNRNGQEIGVDVGNIGVGGFSAGGGIAVATAMMARDKNGPEIKFLMPIYAALDSRNITPSSKQITDPKVWSRRYNQFAWQQYIGNSENPDIYASPALATDFSNLPPTYLYVGELDPLRDEDIAFISKLLAEGVPCEFHLYPGVPHAFDLDVPDAEISRRATAATVEFLKRAVK